MQEPPPAKSPDAPPVPPPLPRPRKPMRWSMVLLLTLFFVPLAVFFVGAFVTYKLPKLYLGEALIQVHQQPRQATLLGATQSLPMEEADRFVATQAGVMTSQKNLARVVQELKLDDTWKSSMESCMAAVRSRLDVTVKPGADLITIRYYDTDPNTAAEIANAVAKAYADRARELVKEQEDKVDEARLRTLDVAERYGLVDLAALGNQPTKTGDPITGIGDEVIQKRNERLAAELRVTEATARMEAADGAGRADVEKKLGELRKALAMARLAERTVLDDASSERRKYAEYSEAQGEYERQRDLLGRMLMSHNEQSLALKLPSFEPVTEHAHATPAMRPARPNVPLNIMISLTLAITAGLLSLGLVVLCRKATGEAISFEPSATKRPNPNPEVDPW